MAINAIRAELFNQLDCVNVMHRFGGFAITCDDNIFHGLFLYVIKCKIAQSNYKGIS